MDWVSPRRATSASLLPVEKGEDSSRPVTGQEEVDAAIAAVNGENAADQVPSLRALSDTLSGILDQREPHIPTPPRPTSGASPH